LPEPRLEVTEHQAPIYSCGYCHGRTTAGSPEGVSAPALYGPRVKAVAIYRITQQLIPEDRAAQTMQDLFGAGRLCPASIVAWTRKKADELAGVVDRIGALVARHRAQSRRDGFPHAGKGQWLHTASPPALTWYRVTEKRGTVRRPRPASSFTTIRDGPAMTVRAMNHRTRSASARIAARISPFGSRNASSTVKWLAPATGSSQPGACAAARSLWSCRESPTSAGSSALP
jgi:hypothetical protein